jgi:PAS domain S-box-containing protein/putative nucleotidyltransferase with HDIG domain
MAIKTGRPVVCRDTETDPAFAPFREAARTRGYRSLTALPIVDKEGVRGALGLYVSETFDWTDEEVELLRELTDDLGFALRAFDEASARERSEAALQASEQRYRHLIETATEGIALLDAERRMTLVNDELCRLLGFEAEELLGALPDLYLLPDDLPTHLKRWEARRAGQVGRRETRLRCKDGTPRWVLVSAQPIVDEAGCFAGALTMFTDIHERKLAEEHARRTLERLRLSTEAAVKTLARTVELRDPYTAGHQERVAELAVAIGDRLKLRPRTMTSLRIAALIHDLGKIAVPAEILARPGALTEAERHLIEQHPERAYEILREMRFPGPVASIVHQHHERLDGSGYPRGLRDKKIHIGSRIIGVADVVEAMSSHRPYRPALGIEAAFAEVESQKGTLYDSAVVDACVVLFREQGFGFSRPV